MRRVRSTLFDGPGSSKAGQGKDMGKGKGKAVAPETATGTAISSKKAQLNESGVEGEKAADIGRDARSNLAAGGAETAAGPSRFPSRAGDAFTRVSGPFPCRKLQILHTD